MTIEQNGKSAVFTAAEVAERADVSVATLRRWVKAGAIPQYDGVWTPGASAHARIVSQLRKSGESLEEIVLAAADGRLALGAADDLFQHETNSRDLASVAKETGLDKEKIEQIWVNMGFPIEGLERSSEGDVDALKRIVTVIDAGLPWNALLQMVRVWAQAFADVADAESRLVRMYVHEPLMREGASGETVTNTMTDLVNAMLPQMTPLMEYVHNRYLQQAVEQAQIENVQGEMGESELGRLEVAVAFVDMAGFTRYTEEVGEDLAFEQVERMRRDIVRTLPDEARLIKMTGDGAMLVSTDSEKLLKWAVRYIARRKTRPKMRVGIHLGDALYRDGDYYGSAINMAARIVARAAGDEVLISGHLRDATHGGRALGLRFASIGSVRLKGFSEPTELFSAELRRS